MAAIFVPKISKITIFRTKMAAIMKYRDIVSVKMTSKFLRGISTYVSQIIFREYRDIVSVKMTSSKFLRGISTFVSQIVFRELSGHCFRENDLKVFKRYIDICVTNHISITGMHFFSYIFETLNIPNILGIILSTFSPIKVFPKADM